MTVSGSCHQSVTQTACDDDEAPWRTTNEVLAPAPEVRVVGDDVLGELDEGWAAARLVEAPGLGAAIEKALTPPLEPPVTAKPPTPEPAPILPSFNSAPNEA